MTLEIIRIHKKLYTFLFVLFLLSFNLNIFGVGLSPAWFDGFDPSSEEITHRTIKCSSDGNYKGGLINLNTDEKDYCKVYPSQFGLQGYIYGGLGKMFPGDLARGYIILVAQFILTLLLSVVLLLFVAFCHEKYGKSVALITAWLLMTSVWLVGYANQMYWVTFIFFLPFLISLLLYPTLKSNKKRWAMFWGVLFVCFMMRFLNGYEYLGATALSAVVPVVYWELRRSDWSLRFVAAISAKIIALSAAAFLLAVSIHVFSMADDYGSVSGAAQALKDRGEIRSTMGMRESFPSTVFNFIDMQPELYEIIDRRKDMDVLYDNKASALVYIGLMIFSYIALPVITLPVELGGIMGVILESFGFWITAAFLSILWFRKHNILSKNEARAHTAVLLVGLTGIISWHVLFMGHALVHAHIVGITYYMPTMLWAYMLVALLIVSVTKKAISDIKTVNR